MLKRLLRIPRIRLLKKILGYDEIYAVAIRRLEDNTRTDTNTFELVKNRKKHWCADPLLYQVNGKQYLFVEEYNRDIGRGHISVAEISNDNRLIYKSAIIENFHMSFPMVFEWDGKIYMIPETSEDRSIRIYIATKFPYEWKCIKRIQTKEKFVDTVLVKKSNDGLAFITSIVNEQNPLETKFQKFLLKICDDDIHIVWDEEFNHDRVFNYLDRSAGNVIIENDDVVLPTQFSSNIDYGVGISFRPINRLFSTEKRKLTIDNVIINGINRKDIIGIHTFSIGHNIEIIDVRYLKFSPWFQYKKIFR